MPSKSLFAQDESSRRRTLSDAAKAAALAMGYDSVPAAMIALIAAGKRNVEIAAILHVCRQTVGSYRRRNPPAPEVAPPSITRPGKGRQPPGGDDQPLPPMPPAERAAWLARVDAMRIPEPLRDGRPIRLRPGERWCSCGEIVPEGEPKCWRCNGSQIVPAASVLRAGEYVER